MHSRTFAISTAVVMLSTSSGFGFDLSHSKIIGNDSNPYMNETIVPPQDCAPNGKNAPQAIAEGCPFNQNVVRTSMKGWSKVMRPPRLVERVLIDRYSTRFHVCKNPITEIWLSWDRYKPVGYITLVRKGIYMMSEPINTNLTLDLLNGEKEAIEQFKKYRTCNQEK